MRRKTVLSITRCPSNKAKIFMIILQMPPIFYKQKEAITSKPNILKLKFKTKMRSSMTKKFLLSPFTSSKNLSIGDKRSA